MKPLVFVEIAKQYGFQIDDFEEKGVCELYFDEKHAVTVMLEDTYLIIKAQIVELATDKEKQLQQLKLALKAALALVRITFAIPYREGSFKRDESGVSVEISNQLLLFRKFEYRDMPRFEVEKEIETFLAALEVYKSRILSPSSKSN